MAGFYVSNYGNTAANRARDTESDPTGTYSKLAEASRSRTTAPDVSTPDVSVPTVSTPRLSVASRTSSIRTDRDTGITTRDSDPRTIVKAQPIPSREEPIQQVSAQPISDDARPEVITTGDEIQVTGMGAVKEGQTYTGKGFAYNDQYGFPHVVSDFQTARQYSGDGNVYVYDGQFSGGYARTPEGQRALVQLPGAKEYGNVLERGEMSPFAPGSLTSLSGNPPEGMIGVISNGEEKFVPMAQLQQAVAQTGQFQIPDVAQLGALPSNIGGDIQSLLQQGTLTSGDLQARIEQRFATHEAIGEQIRNSFGELREQTKASIKSRLETAITGVREQEIGVGREIQAARSQVDVEKQKALRQLRERAAATGQSTGETRLSETRILQEALRESGDIAARDLDFRQTIESNIAGLKSTAASEEAGILFDIEQEETKALISQLQQMDAIEREETQAYLAELQAAANIQNTFLSTESKRIANEAGKLANEAAKLELEVLPEALQLEMEKIKKDLEKAAKEKDTTAIDAQKLALAELNVLKARIAIDVAKMDLTNRTAGEEAIQIFFGALEGGANVVELRSWLSANRGKLEKFGLHDDFTEVVTEVETNKIFPSGMPSIFER